MAGCGYLAAIENASAEAEAAGQCPPWEQKGQTMKLHAANSHGSDGEASHGLIAVPRVSAQMALPCFVFGTRVGARVPPCWTRLDH